VVLLRLPKPLAKAAAVKNVDAGLPGVSTPTSQNIFSGHDLCWDGGGGRDIVARNMPPENRANGERPMAFQFLTADGMFDFQLPTAVLISETCQSQRSYPAFPLIKNNRKPCQRPIANSQ
jgi:hypothetical protein